MRKMKEAVFFLFLLTLLPFSLTGLEFQGWEPAEVREMETKFLEL